MQYRLGSFTIQVLPYKTHRLDPPSTSVKTNKEELLGFFTTMYKMRRMEIAADMMYKAKFIEATEGSIMVLLPLPSGPAQRLSSDFA